MSNSPADTNPSDTPESGEPVASPPQEASAVSPRRGRFLRKPTWVCAVLVIPFCVACLGVLALVLLYRWPRVNWPVFYFTVRPAFVWFGGLLPLLFLGAFALRRRWVLLGMGFWLAGLLMTTDAIQVLKPSPTNARRHFEADRMAYRSFLNSGEPLPGTMTVPLRMVTWNVKGGRRGPIDAMEQLAAANPDIALLQEFSWTGADLVGNAIKEVPFFADFHVDSATRVAIISRFPVERLPTEGLGPYRGTAWLVRVGPDADIVCVNVHLSPIHLRTQLFRGVGPASLRPAIRECRHNIERVGEVIDRYASRGPLILAGDFNVPARYADLNRITGGMKDAFRANGYGWGRTAPANHPKIPFPIVRIDAVFVPDAAEVVYASAAPTKFSDHYMVLAEIVVPVTRAAAQSMAASAGNER